MVCCWDAFDPIPDEVNVKQSVATKTVNDIKSDGYEIRKSDTKPISDDDANDFNDAEKLIDDILVAVNLPYGVAPGQKIRILSPDCQRTVDAFVPRRLNPGETFLVRFPPGSNEPITLQSVPVQWDTRVNPSSRNTLSELTVVQPSMSPTNKSDQSLRFKTGTGKKIPVAPTAPIFIKRMAQLPYNSLPMVFTREVNGGKKRSLARVVDLTSPIPPVIESREDEFIASTDKEEDEYDDVDASSACYSDDSGILLSTPEPPPRGKISQEKRMGRLSSVERPIDVLTAVPGNRPLKNSSQIFLPSSDATIPIQYARLGASEFSRRQESSIQDTSQMRFVAVEVPPGLAPRSSIFVEIPGENRTVAANVPPNVSSFHVAYLPQTDSTTRIPPPPTQEPAVVTTTCRHAGLEKLLRINIPPGTLPGTTLFVTIPDEPGRILSAQVPSGIGSMMHVSYIPSEQPMEPHSRGMRSPNSPRVYGRDPPSTKQSKIRVAPHAESWVQAP